MRGRTAASILSPLLLLSLAVSGAAAEVIGTNPGGDEGRWLQVADPAAMRGYRGVYLGEVVADIHWKEGRNVASIEEDLLQENLGKQVAERLRESRVLGELLAAAPPAGAEGYLRLDCKVDVQPGSRMKRFAIGLGAGRSKSVLELRMVDHASGEEVGLYHGFGVGSGMGLKLAGGGVGKMTQDDIQENTKMFVQLVEEMRGRAVPPAAEGAAPPRIEAEE